MKNIKFNKVFYKLIGLIVIDVYLIYLNKSFFISPTYGNYSLYALIAVIDLIYLLLPYIFDKVVASIILTLFLVYYIVETVYFELFGQYIYINGMFSLFNEAKDYFSSVTYLITSKEIMAIVFLIIVIVVLSLNRYEKKKHKLITIDYLLMIIVCMLFGSTMCLKETKAIESSSGDSDIFAYNETDRYIYDKKNPSVSFVDLFGIEQYLYRDFTDNIFVNKKKTNEEKETVKEFLSNNLSYQTNEMTGILSSKHLLIIEGESLNMAAIDEELTPTLYKIINEGWYFKNYYSPLMPASTSDAEVMCNTSLLPLDNGEVVSQSYADNEYPTTLAKKFKENGYITTAAHNNYKLYYNRENFFSSLGYEYFLDAYELGLDNLSSDYLVSDKLGWVSVGYDLSYTFWVTYSGHQPYSVVDLDDTSTYPSATSEEYKGYLEQVKAKYPDVDEDTQFYIAKNMSLDRAVSRYIEIYNICEKRDDLVIAIYGDHYVKGFDFDAVKEQLSRSVNDTPFAIWYNGIEPKTIEKNCTTIDIMPTLFNLYGISYDKETILGNDIFDDRYHGYRFDSFGTVWTDDFNYAVASKEYGDLKISKDEAREILGRYQSYQEISDLIILDNYFGD